MSTIADTPVEHITPREKAEILAQALPYIRSGRLNALAVLGPKRSPLLPDVPTVGEAVPGFELTNWFGLAVPAATPRELVAKLYADVVKVLQQNDVKVGLHIAEGIGHGINDTGLSAAARFLIESFKLPMPQ